MKLTDLKDLRVVKKSLEPEPEPKPQQNQPRKRFVVLKSKEEEHARNEGLVIGQKVRMMDTNDTAAIEGNADIALGNVIGSNIFNTLFILGLTALLTVSDKGLGFLCDPKYGQLVGYKSLMSAFADPVVMLFLGGFVLAIMAEKYGLDVTLARLLLKPFGTKPKMVLLGFFWLTKFFPF